MSVRVFSKPSAPIAGGPQGRKGVGSTIFRWLLSPSTCRSAVHSERWNLSRGNPMYERTYLPAHSSPESIKGGSLISSALKSKAFWIFSWISRVPSPSSPSRKGVRSSPRTSFASPAADPCSTSTIDGLPLAAKLPPLCGENLRAPSSDESPNRLGSLGLSAGAAMFL